jgi:lambda family phage portal protein
MGSVLLSDWTIPAPVKQAQPQARLLPAVKARYDAATIDDDNRRHWANADNLSARQANSAEVRDRLRRHARYEVANNCYARGIVNTLADITIGYGPTLVCESGPRGEGQANYDDLSEVARLFVEWAEEINLWGKLWTMRVSKAQDGEAFAIMRTNRRLQGAVQLDLQLLEAEQVTDGVMGRDWLDPRQVDGLDLDDFGNPLFYKVLADHPGDSIVNMEPVRVPASQMLHWFRCDRPGQVRGIPEITPALPLFAQLRRFTLATLTAAETAADIAGLLKTTLPTEDEDLPASWEQIPIERGTLTTLPEGYDLSQMKAEHPTTTYEMFKREILCEIGRVLQLPKMVTLLDASNYNYSSGRLDKQTTDRAIDVERYQCDLQILRKIWGAWFAEAVRITGYLPASVEAGMAVRPRWLWQQLGHVDRMKEANGAAVELANNTTTLADECARAGLDYREVIRQRARELAELREAGLVQSAPEQQQQTGGTPGSVDDDEEVEQSS